MKLPVPLFQLPNSTNPFFNLERKWLKWGQTHQKAKKQSRQFVLRRVVIIMGLWLAWVFMSGSAYGQLYQAGYYLVAFDAIVLIFPVSFALSYLLDMATIAQTLNSINQEKTLGRWDLLRLAMDEKSIVQAKYDLARLQTWRLYLLMFSIRLSVALMFLIILFIFSSSTGETPTFEGTLIADILMFIILMMIIASYFFLEPFWRVKAITAMGVALSARAKSITMTAIYGFAALVGTWILQVVLFGFGTFTYIQMISSSTVMNSSVVFFLLMIYFALVIGGTNLFYRGIERTSFAAIHRRFDQ